MICISQLVATLKYLELKQRSPQGFKAHQRPQKNIVRGPLYYQLLEANQQRISPHAHSLYTRGNKIAPPDYSCRQKSERHGRSIEQQFRGITLQDYVRGRCSSEHLKPSEPSGTYHRASQVIRLKQEDTGMCFERNYEIEEEEDEQNYTETRQKLRNQKQEHIFPDLVEGRKKGSYLQTEKSQANRKSPTYLYRQRMKTISQHQVFLPIHYKQPILRAEARRSIGNREQRNRSRNRMEEEQRYTTNHQSPLISSYKIKTMSDFYKNQKPFDLSAIRVELNYATKYNKGFLEGRQPRKNSHIH